MGERGFVVAMCIRSGGKTRATMRRPPRFPFLCLRRFAGLIAPLALAPALFACSSPPAGPAPLSEAALAAVIEDPGVDRERLARAVDALFTKDPGTDSSDETRAVIVMRGSRIVAERYAPGYHENTRFAGGAMVRSVTAVMIGMLVSDGRLRLNETAPVPAWQRPGDPRGEITLRHLLQMRAGLRQSASDDAAMLFGPGRDDMARAAEDQPLGSEPGARFHDNAADGVILADLAARVLAPGGDAEARRRAVAEYLRTRLFEPVQMRGVVLAFDAHGTMDGGAMIDGTARDFARFGAFLRNRGAVQGAQLVPRQWIEFMASPSPRAPQYGAGLWLNRGETGGRGDEAARLFPDRGPRDLIAALGNDGEAVLASPSRRLVIVRLGRTSAAGQSRLTDQLADLAALFR